jgi:hypothetical protein
VAIPGALLDRERDFARAFVPAALTGVRLDPVQVSELAGEHARGREAARQRAESLSDGQITNPKSSVQTAAYLASTGRYELPRSEKTGKPGAPKGVLEQYAYTGDQLADAILAYRRADTALGLLLAPRQELIEHGDGRVRTSILTLAANTGRTSSRNENLQQVSRQGGMRACHLAEPGCLIVSADWSSVEIRVGAALSGDESMKALIALGDKYPEKKKEYDFHWRTAITCYGPEATKENRYNCKRVNFCVPEEGTEILTERGWLRHDEVVPGDRTLARNPATGYLEWTRIISVPHFSGADVVRLENGHKSWSAVVTPNHRWVTDVRRRRNGATVFEEGFTETRSLTTEHRIILGGRALTHQLLPITPAEAALIAWAYTDGHVIQSEFTGRTSQGTDGRRQKLHVTISQAKPEGIAALERVLRETGAGFRKRGPYDTNTGALAQYSWLLDADYARDLWNRAGLLYAARKTDQDFALNESWVLRLDMAHRRAFLQACLDAEGWQDGKTGGWRLSQNEGPVLAAIKLAASLEGWYVREHVTRDPRGSAPNSTLVLSPPRVTMQRVTRTPAGTADVWCVETELGSWLMRQHGQVMLTGNSKMYGSGKRSASEQVGIPLPEVSAAFDAFSAIAPGYEAWDNQMREYVRAGGKSFRTYSGREIWLTGKGEHAAGNAAIQGTAREFLVDAVALWEKGPWGGHVIVPIHDELVCFDIPEDEAEAATAFLVECMTTAINGVDIIAEPNSPSPFWMDASLGLDPARIFGRLPAWPFRRTAAPPVSIPMPCRPGTCSARGPWPTLRSGYPATATRTAFAASGSSVRTGTCTTCAGATSRPTPGSGTAGPARGSAVTAGIPIRMTGGSCTAGARTPCTPGASAVMPRTCTAWHGRRTWPGCPVAASSAGRTSGCTSITTTGTAPGRKAVLSACEGCCA